MAILLKVIKLLFGVIENESNNCQYWINLHIQYCDEKIENFKLHKQKLLLKLTPELIQKSNSYKSKMDLLVEHPYVLQLNYFDRSIQHWEKAKKNFKIIKGEQIMVERRELWI